MDYSLLVKAFSDAGLPITVVIITGILAFFGLRYMKNQGDKQNENLRLMAEQHKQILRATYWLMKQQQEATAKSDENQAKAINSLNETLKLQQEVLERYEVLLIKQDETLEVRNRAAQVILNNDSRSFTPT